MKPSFPLAALLLAVSAAAQQQPTAATSSTAPKDLATLEGRTTAPGGQPLRKTALSLRPAVATGGEMPQPYGATSDAEGKFRFEGVEPGRYLLMAQHPGYLNTSYGAKRNTMSGTQLTLTAGQQMKDVNIELTPQAVISGHVLDDEGDPAARAQVQLQRWMFVSGKRQLVPAGFGQSDDNGEYKISSVAPGRYYLRVTPIRQNMYGETARRAAADADKPEESLTQTYYPGVTDAGAASPIEVVAGREMPGLDVRLRKTQVFRIKGKLTGVPVDGVTRLRVTVVPRENLIGGMMMGGSGNVAKDGSFEIDGVSPGAYILMAMNTMGSFRAVARQPIDIANRSVDGVALGVQPPAEVRGMVRIEGQPKTDDDPKTGKSPTAPSLTAVQIQLLATEGPSFNMQPAKIQTDGSFTIADVAPGRYRVNIYSTPEGTYLKSAQAGDQDALAGFDAGAGSSGLVITLSAAAGEVDGTVQTDQQQPAQGSIVTLIPDPPPAPGTMMHRYKQASTDQNGSYAMKGVAPGKYRIYSWEDLDSGEQFDPDFLKMFENLGTKISVEENGRPQTQLTRISSAQVEEARRK